MYHENKVSGLTQQSKDISEGIKSEENIHLSL